MNKVPANTGDRARRDQALFDSIARTYCRKDLVESNRTARRHRLLRTLDPSATSRAEKPDILEIGCGAGFSAQYLRGYYRTYTGLDYSRELIQHARERFESDDTHFLAENFHDYESTNRYDIIIMIGVLHHMNDKQSVLRKCLSLLKPGGSLVANEPQPDNPFIHFMRRVRARVDSGYSAEQEELTAGFLINEYEKAGFINVGSIPQGIFSTPLAEVTMNPQFLFAPVSKLACAFDMYFENRHPGLIRKLTWNTIVYGTNGEA